MKTARVRFRTNWRGKLILQVEVRHPKEYPPGSWNYRWRDAKLTDVNLEEFQLLRDER